MHSHGWWSLAQILFGGVIWWYDHAQKVSGLCNLFGEIGKIWNQGHGGIIWEFMEQHKQGLLHKPQIIGISLLLEKGIFVLDIWWLWMRWITGMALEMVGNKGH